MLSLRTACPFLLLLFLIGCSNGDQTDANAKQDGGTPDLGADASRADAGSLDAPAVQDAGPDAALTDRGPVDVGSLDSGPGPSVSDQARALTTHLRGHTNFMIGHGNNNSGAYDNNIPIDLHYTYLVGYGDQGGWTTWNTPDGAYVDYRNNNAQNNGVTPMFTYYQMALELENNNYGVFTDDSRMRQYLLDFRLLFERLAVFDGPAVVHVEPDFFGYLQNRVRTTGVPPDQMTAHIHFADFHDCDALPQTVVGFMRCLILMSRNIAPKTRIGFHASQWGAWYDKSDPNADVVGLGQEVADFLVSVGASESDFITVENLDRDAGFWETEGGGPTCSERNGSRGAVYWDETNTTFPNFTQHLTWVRAITDRAQLPSLWWQLPLGVPSNECGGPGGGSDGHWRDNRVHYFFNHIDELVHAGGAGAAFGTGAGRQTTIDSDGDQFKNAATSYAQSPVAL